VTQSSLAFREAVRQQECDEDYQLNDHTGVRLVYGLEAYRSLHQELSAINTNYGRIMVISYVFKHRVQPFTLVDSDRATGISLNFSCAIQRRRSSQVRPSCHYDVI